MRILQQHVEFIEYEPIKKEIASAEEAEKKKVKYEDIVVLFTTVETGDDEAIAKKAIEDVAKFLKNLGKNTILIYPYAHLSSNLAKPQDAIAELKSMESNAKELGITVHTSPFGWNKQYSLKIKGHPLAEQSRNYGATPITQTKVATEKGKELEVTESNALKEEEKVVSTWYILDPKLGLVEASKYDFKGHEKLKQFADYEIKKVRTYAEVPPHIHLMRKLRLVDYEPGSDPGNMRYYPNGRLMKSLLERYVTARAIEYGAVEVETPVMYDYEHPALKNYLGRFPARHYIVKSEEKEYFLRFAACFGQFLMMHDTTVSYKHLPFKVYELARYAFRREKSGEVSGLKRLRAFTMPDMHTMCADLKQAEQEFDAQFKFCQSVLADIGIEKEDYEAAIRFTTDFWNNNKDFVNKLVREYLGKPALIEMWSFRYAYFDPKFEFNIVDSAGKASSLSTVQIDHENGTRYDLKYVDKEGANNSPIILHCSPSGAIERILYALLELSDIKAKAGKTQMLPLWLSPIQVRLLPISDKYINKCIELAESMKTNGIRVDVDDSDETLGKKISTAEKEWIPYTCIIGEKEIATGNLALRVRETKMQESITLNSLIERIKKELGSMPMAPLTVPMLLSKRPIFFG
ncbi:MAG: threonine--tRNA ligase [Candidatus Micrarchaeota archaeon]|nr:threonine--tRNA ligase [Candidatus Micrarchaeota archaeon]